MTSAAIPAARPHWSRAAEAVTLYVGGPLVMALLLPPSALFPALFALTAAGLALLAMTPGFRWAELVRGWGAIDWRRVGLIAAGTALICAAAVWLLVPEQALRLPRTAPGLWLMILLLYPILSALPQEIVFRPLFFRRYGALFPGVGAAVAANAVAFGFAHLMFWNWVAVGLSAAGGLLFALGYLNRGGFAMAVVLHAVCGGIVFTSGLGSFFYHGAAPLR